MNSSRYGPNHIVYCHKVRSLPLLKRTKPRGVLLIVVVKILTPERTEEGAILVVRTMIVHCAFFFIFICSSITSNNIVLKNKNIPYINRALDYHCCELTANLSGPSFRGRGSFILYFGEDDDVHVWGTVHLNVLFLF